MKTKFTIYKLTIYMLAVMVLSFIIGFTVGRVTL